MADTQNNSGLPPDIIDVALENLSKQVQDIRNSRDSLPPPKDGPTFQPAGIPPPPKWTKIERDARVEHLNASEYHLKKNTIDDLAKSLEDKPVGLQVNSFKKIYKWQDENRSEHDKKYEQVEKDAVSGSQGKAMRMFSDRSLEANEPNEKNIEIAKEERAGIDIQNPTLEVEKPVSSGEIDSKSQMANMWYANKLSILGNPPPPGSNQDKDLESPEHEPDRE